MYIRTYLVAMPDCGDLHRQFVRRYVCSMILSACKLHIYVITNIQLKQLVVALFGGKDRNSLFKRLMDLNLILNNTLCIFDGFYFLAVLKPITTSTTVIPCQPFGYTVCLYCRQYNSLWHAYWFEVGRTQSKLPMTIVSPTVQLASFCQHHGVVVTTRYVPHLVSIHSNH